MEVGTLVALKVACLGNLAGTVGVVYYNYGDGFQVIFPNGNYDGFSTTVERGLFKDWECSEADYFLEKVGFCEEVANYQFKNVSKLSWDFDSGIFDVALKKIGA